MSELLLFIDVAGLFVELDNRFQSSQCFGAVYNVTATGETHFKVSS